MKGAGPRRWLALAAIAGGAAAGLMGRAAAGEAAAGEKATGEKAAGEKAAGEAAAGEKATVWTAIDQVAACAPLDRGGVAIGTPGGLALLDPAGRARAVLTARDGLPATSVRALWVDRAGLWVGTDRGAALVAAAAGGQLHRVRSVLSPPVRDLVRVGRTVYLATWGGGVIAVAPDGRATPLGFGGRRPGRRLAAARVQVAALARSGGTLWAGTAAGLYRLERGRLVAAPLPAGSGPARPAITALAATRDRLYLGTAGGLIERGPRGALALGGGDIRRLAVIDGQLVAAVMGGGLVALDRGRLRPLRGGPPALRLAQTVAAGRGAACAGGLGGLWLRRSGGRWARAPLAGERALPSNNLSALAWDGERLWIGTFDRGAVVLEHGRFRPVGAGEIDPRVNAIAIDPKDRGRVWLATAGGLFALDRGRVTRMTERDGLPARNILSLAWLAGGQLLVGTTRGAALVGRGRPRILGPKRGLHLGNVWAALEDQDGYVWLGTTTGLWRGRADGGTLRRFSLATGELPDDWVMALAARGRSLWVGTYKGGVTRLDWHEPGPGAAMQVTQLGGGWVNPGGLSWTGGALFAATMTGLIAGDGAGGGWRALGGLPGRDVTAVLGTPGGLWIATRRGLVRFDRATDGGLAPIDVTGAW